MFLIDIMGIFIMNRGAILRDSAAIPYSAPRPAGLKVHYELLGLISPANRGVSSLLEKACLGVCAYE